MLADIDVDDYVVVSEHDAPGTAGEGATDVAASPETDEPGLDNVGFIALCLCISLHFAGGGHGVSVPRRPLLSTFPRLL